MTPLCTPQFRRLTAAVLALCLLSAISRAHPGHYDAAGVANTIPPSAASPSNSVSITRERDFLIIKSNGWPDHAPGAFPRRGNPNTVSPQNYTFRVPLKPKIADAPERRGGWWWGVALNGVPFEPGTAETWNNDPRSGWRYEAATGFLNLGLDEHNAHVQPNGSYHYHALPSGLVERLGGDGKQMRHLGWAADGFPIYSAWAHTEAKDAKSALRKMKSSYRLKPGARRAQDGGPGGNYDGRFTQDFEFVKDSGDLDDCNGRSGVTPEFPDGTYYYCLTAEFPFVPRMWRGMPDQSFSKGDLPPGGGPGRATPGGPPRGIIEDAPGALPPPGAARPPFPPLMQALDANGDHRLDADEIKSAPEALRKLDKNGDGELTPAEYRPVAPSAGSSPPAEPGPAR